MDEVQAGERLTADDLDRYIKNCFAMQDDLGAAYVTRQVEWAENLLQQRLREESC